MDPVERRLRALSQTAADWVDKATDEDRVVTEARQRLLRDWARRPRSRSPSALVWLAAAAALGGVVVVLILGPLSQRTEPVSFLVEAPQAAELGRWLETGDGTLQLRFSEGTRVSLHPNTKLQVQNTTPLGAELLLARGRALTRVRPQEHARWTLRAGPFTVAVTGTEFEIGWDPETEVFELVLHEGSVRVSGPQLPGERRVNQGEHLRVNLKVPRVAEPQSESDELTQVAPAASPSPIGKSLGSLSASPRDALSWRKALGEGKWREVWEVLDQEGTERILEQATAGELSSLADAARLGGRPRLATQALERLRSRYGVREQTAYLLGKIAADQLRSRAEAVRWFEAYLQENPHGTLAEQALGRLIELQPGTGSGRAVARRYLKKYPEGAFSTAARRELEERP